MPAHFAARSVPRKPLVETFPSNVGFLPQAVKILQRIRQRQKFDERTRTAGSVFLLLMDTFPEVVDFAVKTISWKPFSTVLHKVRMTE
jgi:hypothetical protein